MNDRIINSGKTVGRSHLRDNTPCQDSVLSLQRDDVSVIALSDGCGSEPFSEAGSNITVSVLCSQLVSRFDDFFSMDEKMFRQEIVHAVIDEIKNYIAQNPDLIHQYNKKNPDHYTKFVKSFPNCSQPEKAYQVSLFNATVQFVAEKGTRIIAGRLGDGIIGAVKNNALTILSSEDKIAGINQENSNGTYYPTTAVLLPAWGQFEIIRQNNAAEYSMFFIVSDGVADVICGSDEDDREHFLFPDEISNILNSKSLTQLLEEQYKPIKGIYDDLSIVEMHSPVVRIDAIAIREYDQTGRTIANQKLHRLPESIVYQITTTVPSAVINAVELEPEISIDERIDKCLEILKKYYDKDMIERLQAYFGDDQSDPEYYPFFLEQIVEIMKSVGKKESVGLDSVFKDLQPLVEEDDWELIQKHITFLKLFVINKQEKTIRRVG